MRPPVLPSGNLALELADAGRGRGLGFNEAAGFTQRKRGRRRLRHLAGRRRFNEAAGFTQRKRPIAYRVGVQSGPRFNEAAGFTQRKHKKENQ